MFYSFIDKKQKGYRVITEEKFLDALHVLYRQEQLVLLVQLCEKWAQKKTLSAQMNLLLAKTFFDLCLLEHAWQRLQAVPDDVPKREMVVEIMLKKGWITKARSALIALQTIDKQHHRIEEFNTRIRNGLQIPKNPEHIIKQGIPSHLINLAEQYICLGKGLVGQKILIRVIQQEPQNQYARRLLWAQRGDFSTSLSLMQLWNQIVFDQEHEVEPTFSGLTTTSVSTQQTKAEKSKKNTAYHSTMNFPQLFRSEEPEVSIEELTSEVTNAFVFSSPGEEATQKFDDFLGEDKDTVAMDVMHSNSGHRSLQNKKFAYTETVEATGAFNPKKYTKESNDEEVISFVDQEPKTTEIRIPPKVLEEMVVIEKIPVSTVERREPTPSHDYVDKNSYLAEHAKAVKPKKQSNVIKGAIFAVVVVLIVLALLFFGMTKFVNKNVSRNSIPILLSADKQALVQLRTQLKYQYEQIYLSKMVYRDHLLLANYMYWREYSREDDDLREFTTILASIPEGEYSDVVECTMALYSFDTGVSFLENTYISNCVESENSDLQNFAQFVQMEMGQLSSSIALEPLLRFPRMQVSAIVKGYIEPDVEAENPWIQVVSLQRMIGQLDVTYTGEMLEEIAKKKRNLGALF